MWPTITIFSAIMASKIISTRNIHICIVILSYIVVGSDNSSSCSNLSACHNDVNVIRPECNWKMADKRAA